MEEEKYASKFKSMENGSGKGGGHKTEFDLIKEALERSIAPAQEESKEDGGVESGEVRLNETTNYFSLETFSEIEQSLSKRHKLF